MLPASSAQMMYSLTILNGVNPFPATKQTGNVL